MILRPPVPSSPRSGSVLLWAVFGAMAIFTSAFVVSTLASSSRRIADSDFQRTSAHYLSEGALSIATEVVAEALTRGEAPPAQGSTTIDDEPVSWTIAGIAGPEGLEVPASAAIARLYRLEGSAARGGVRATSRRVVRGLFPAPDEEATPGTSTVRLEEVVSW